MKPRPHRPLPPQQQHLRARMQRLSWWSIGMLLATATLMYLTMGNSQAMKTAWVEDMLSLVPPIALLLAARFAGKPADDTYINGRQRAYEIAFLVSSVALVGVGAWLLVESVIALVTQEHPTIGGISIFGVYFWQGWLMIAALAMATWPPLLLGHMKLKLARQLHLKSLHADAKMNKADWMTAAAGAFGVAGIGMGWWWADATAAIVISADIVTDGVKNLRHSIRDMHDAYPQTVDRGDKDPHVEHIRDAVLALDGVEACRLRLHEEGMRLCGVVIVRLADGVACGQADRGQRLHAVREAALSGHWRVDDVAVVLDDDDRAPQ